MVKLPSDAGLRQLVQTGWKDGEIAAVHGVTISAVGKRRREQNLYKKPVAARVTDMINDVWNVKTTSGGDSHHARRPLQGLKYCIRKQLGDELSPPQERRAQNLIDRLRREDAVLDYDRETPQGVFFVPRTPEDGRRLMRWPAGKPLPSADLQAAMELPASAEGD
ncbi:hypothetical protein GCM10009544_18040 [Streptomyces stramineus]|uniref:Immunity repressor n=2 Tax=Streptomyces stramineus TaxID=173861 RepID=A0ABN0ZQI9_9ACTN